MKGHHFETVGEIQEKMQEVLESLQEKAFLTLSFVKSTILHVSTSILLTCHLLLITLHKLVSLISKTFIYYFIHPFYSKHLTASCLKWLRFVCLFFLQSRFHIHKMQCSRYITEKLLLYSNPTFDKNKFLFWRKDLFSLVQIPLMLIFILSMFCDNPKITKSDFHPSLFPRILHVIMVVDSFKYLSYIFSILLLDFMILVLLCCISGSYLWLFWRLLISLLYRGPSQSSDLSLYWEPLKFFTLSISDLCLSWNTCGSFEDFWCHVLSWAFTK